MKRVFLFGAIFALLTGCTAPTQRPLNSLAAPTASADILQAGERVFSDECSQCHGFTPGRNSKGPQLLNVYGNSAGLLAEYRGYSDALRQSRVIWSLDTLDRYLKQPTALIPNGRMHYDGLTDPAKRQQVIAWLAQQRRPVTTTN